MGSGQITLSVIIPAYNYASTLRRAVLSVTHQMQVEHELIVIDDGSTDGTPAVTAQLSEELKQCTVRFIRKENGGASSARNVGILNAQGAYLVFLDADDELAPDALAKLATHFALNPESRMVIGGHISVFPDGKMRTHLPTRIAETPEERLQNYLLDKKLILCNGACAMHKEIFTRGTYPESFRSAEDIPVFAQALANFHCTAIQAPLARIYKHDDSLRHQFSHAKAGGLLLVDEVFAPQRLGAKFQHLKNAYLVQRSLSLFRSAYLAKDYPSAKHFYIGALKNDWRVLLKLSYSRKALRVWCA